MALAAQSVFGSSVWCRRGGWSEWSVDYFDGLCLLPGSVTLAEVPGFSLGMFAAFSTLETEVTETGRFG